MRSKLHRNFGKLYASQARFDEALKELANDVFYSSLEIGPEHIDTAGGYYHMATIFFSRVRGPGCNGGAVVGEGACPGTVAHTHAALFNDRIKSTTLSPSTTRSLTSGTSS